MAVITLLVSAVLIGVDQFTKYLIVLNLKPISTAPLIPGIISLFYHENTGAAFGLLAGTGQTTALAVVTGIALLALLIYLLVKPPKAKLEYTALLLLFAGGAGNFIDRITKQKVVDFFNFEFINFPIFNVADILVTTGFVLFMIVIIKMTIAERKEALAKPESTGEGALASRPALDEKGEDDAKT